MHPMFIICSSISCYVIYYVTYDTILLIISIQCYVAPQQQNHFIFRRFQMYIKSCHIFYEEFNMIVNSNSNLKIK